MKFPFSLALFALIAPLSQVDGLFGQCVARESFEKKKGGDCKQLMSQNKCRDWQRTGAGGYLGNVRAHRICSECGKCVDKEDGDKEATTSGDPHFKTWNGEHFEYHGQCDLVLVKVPDFADGLGLDIHMRTKIVRYWSYNKNAVIRIGTDILEVTGSGDDNDWEPHYWMNYEPKGELTTIGGFPVKTEAPASAYKRTYEIDLDSKYPGQKIILQIYKEFVRVDIKNANKESFGNAIGILGEFTTGKTLARDGATEMNDFVEYGSEWQVLPSEPKLFHEMETPQFPQKCIEPEDPRGERRRRRRLDESNITMEQAEAACSSLKDPLDRKDCVYDTIATQDLGMVGAY